MDRWTMDELERTDDLTFAICILDERRSRLNRYSPLSMKIQAAQQTLRRIKDAQDRFMQDICPLTEKEIGEAMDKAADIVTALDEAEDSEDLSELDGETKRMLLENDAALKAREEAEI